MKRDTKLNPFDPRNPEYWLRKHLIGTTKIDYGTSVNPTPGNWGYNQYLFEPKAISLINPALIKDWNERSYSVSMDPNPAEEELVFMLAQEYPADPDFIKEILENPDTDPWILNKIKETKKMMENKITH